MCDADAPHINNDFFGAMDCVKLAAGVVFNSTGQLIRGLCCSVDDMHGLHDVFQMVLRGGHGNETKYALQYSFGSLTSSFMFLGPFFEFDSEPLCKVVHPLTQNVLVAMEKHKFNVRLMICDAASINLQVIAAATRNEDSSPLEHVEDPDFDHWLLRPFSLHPSTGEKLFWMIDPPHQCKSVRNWLIESNSEACRMLVNHDSESKQSQYVTIEHLRQMYSLPSASLGTDHMLDYSDLWFLTSFEKMWVGPAMHVLNTRVSSALKGHKSDSSSSAHPSAGELGATIEFVETFAGMFQVLTRFILIKIIQFIRDTHD
jgi:hypothetical protein